MFLEAFMKNCLRPLCVASLAVLAVLALHFTPLIGAPPPQGQGQAQAPPPRPLPWAYAVLETPLPPAEATDDGLPKHVPGSTMAYTMKQIRDNANPVDWFPSDHPPMPSIVAHRRSPTNNPWIGGCGFCHFPNGKGRPENAGIAGLPAGYILAQLADFKNGARRAGDPGKRNTNTMIGNAAGLTDEEATIAAEYFASIKMTPWIKVVEAETVPKTRNAGGFYMRLEGNETEPIGQRILEVPVDNEGTEVFRNPRSGFIAYAPVGSVKKGEDLVVRGGAGKTVACAACHGEGLKGNGNFPPLAGRSPSYLARQLYDIQKYARNGPGTQLMRPIVQNQNEADMLAITAYLASLAP